MERLTNNIDYCQLHCDFGKEKDCLFTDKSKCYENNMYNKLREYEIAEEQELMLKLPCKVGDIVYSLEYGKIIERTVDLFEVWENSLWCFEKNHIIIGGIGSTVFATKEEAEQALAEKKGV